MCQLVQVHPNLPWDPRLRDIGQLSMNHEDKDTHTTTSPPVYEWSETMVARAAHFVKRKLQAAIDDRGRLCIATVVALIELYF